jgi:hypothetical protein
MKSMHILAAAFAANLAFLAAPVSASAKLVLETATYTGVDTGETIVQDGRFVGAAFRLGATEQITNVGAQFGGFPGGTIFAAIVPLASQTSLPSFAPSDIAVNAIADVVLSVPQQGPEGGPIDYNVPLSVSLPTGSYAVVFGSGAFGPTASPGLASRTTSSDRRTGRAPSSTTCGARTLWMACGLPSPPLPSPRPGQC